MRASPYVSSASVPFLLPLLSWRLDGGDDYLEAVEPGGLGEKRPTAAGDLLAAVTFLRPPGWAFDRPVTRVLLVSWPNLSNFSGLAAAGQQQQQQPRVVVWSESS